MSATIEHISGCSAWHHQGGDADRDCPACMELLAADEPFQRACRERFERRNRGDE